MNSHFTISETWTSTDGEPDEFRQTSGLLTVKVGKHVATRVDDEWSKSVRDDVIVSAYPLALWFAAAWFRLRWETFPNTELNVGWRMAHDMPAAGHGYVWPPLRFVWEGETVQIICRPTRSAARSEPIRYLERFTESISANGFEQTIEGFIELVLARLEAVGIQETQLQTLWPEVMRERMDPEAARYRRLEAQLGYDPDEAPSGAVDELVKLARVAGEAASAEIAPACSGANPGVAINRVFALAESGGTPVTLRSLPTLPPNDEISPWKRGYLLAREARAFWGIQNDRVDDRKLDELFNADVVHADAADTEAPLSLAVRNGDPSALRLLFRRQHPRARRFEAARFLAEALYAPAADHWLPSTDSKTARQEVQRNFAAEFLCPIEKLSPLFPDNNFYNEATIEKAARHFKVGERTVISQLANHGRRRRFSA